LTVIDIDFFISGDFTYFFMTASKPQKMKMALIPHYGEIGAGTVVPFVAQSELVPVGLPDDLAASGDVFGLTIRGISLEDESIYDGDLLICNKRFAWRDITPTTICAVYIIATAELAAKKVIRGANMLTLRASGGGIKDLHYSPDDIEIRGIAIGFQRLFKNDHPLKKFGNNVSQMKRRRFE
jgi:repressor LexA